MVRPVLIVVAALALCACSVGPLSTPSPSQSGEPVVAPSSSEQSQTPTTSPGAAPSEGADSPQPAGSPPIAIPDPPGGLPAVRAGESFEIGQSSVTFDGFEQRDDGWFATFTVDGGTLAGARLVIGQQVIAAEPTATGYEAGPFDLPPAGGVEPVIALAVNETIVPLELSPTP